MLNTLFTKSSSPTGKSQRLHLFEYTLYALVLVVALGIPFFIGSFAYYGWKIVFEKWMRLLPYVIVFLANNFLMAPKMLFREKYLYYILTCILSVVAVFVSVFLFAPPAPPGEMFPLPGDMPPFPFKDMLPPSGKMLPPLPFEGMPPPPFMPPPLYFNFGAAITAILLIGFNTGVKFFVRWSEDKISQTERERQHLHTELAFLKQQISPHFFMNTLNNIHALVDINTEKAKNAIIKLSHMMRYLLYESDAQRVLLKKEINFIESYIELMRLRYDEDNLTIETEYPENTETIYVPSSLFLTFIENAFKHGINMNDHSLITIRFSADNGWLTFRIVNRLWNITARPSETTGIGLENVRKRLELTYREYYSLDINSYDQIFDVILIIPVS